MLLNNLKYSWGCSWLSDDWDGKEVFVSYSGLANLSRYGFSCGALAVGGAYFDMKESNALLNLGSVSSTPGQPFAFKVLGAIRESIWDLSICLKSGSTLLDL